MTDLTQVVRELRVKAEQFTQAADTLAELDSSAVSKAAPTGKRIVSAQARRKMQLAQRARWARIKAAKQPRIVARKAA